MMKVISFSCLIFLWLMGCQGQRTYTSKSVLPVVSIDAFFIHQDIKDGEAHSRRLTSVFSRLMDSIAMDSSFRFVHNYRDTVKHLSNFTIDATISKSLFGKSTKAVNSFSGRVYDRYAMMYYDDFGCYGKIGDDLGCLCFDPVSQDSTDYKKLVMTLRMGFLLKYLVPFRKILSPKNISDTTFKSFSLNRFLVASDPKTRDVAIALTHLINNSMVYNQTTYDRKIFKNHFPYNYFDNYKLKRSLKQTAEFTVGGEVVEQEDLYELHFEFGGPNLNLTVPHKIDTILFLEKKRILQRDYSEAMLKISKVLSAFRLQNIAL